MTTWQHDALQDDLAGYLRSTGDRVIWTNMPMGSMHSQRPDVFSIPKSYSKFKPLVYEVKVTLADFRRDITAGKWHGYLEFAAAVIFAVPQGLVSKADVPKGCGLIIRTEYGWTNVKGPTLQPVTSLPHDVWMKLVIDGLGRQAKADRQRAINQVRTQEEVRKRYGEAVAWALSDRDSALEKLESLTAAHRCELDDELSRHEREMKRLRESAVREKAELNRDVAVLAGVLGLEPNCSVYSVQSAARKAARLLDRDQEVQRLRAALQRAESVILRAAEEVSEKLKEATPLVKSDLV